MHETPTPPPERFVVLGNSVLFYRTGDRFHISFSEKYHDHKTYSSLRRALRRWHTRASQDEIMHYLKTLQVL